VERGNNANSSNLAKPENRRRKQVGPVFGGMGPEAGLNGGHISSPVFILFFIILQIVCIDG